MKKTILLIAAVISLTGNAIAQDGDNDSRGRLMFGLKGGANYSNVYDEQGEAFRADPKVGAAVYTYYKLY